MELEHSFDIEAEPDVVFAYLLDVNRVAACVPGVTMQEAPGEDTFRGTLKVKVGPVTVRYGGVGRIVSTDPVARVATIKAEGEEAGAAGSVRANATMSVTPTPAGSHVTVHTDLAIAGRVATMGKGVIEQVGNRMVAQTSQRIERAILESTSSATPAGSAMPAVDATPAGSATAAVDATLAGSATAAVDATLAVDATPAVDAMPAPAVEDESALRVLPLLRSVTAEWLRRVFGRMFGARRTG